MKKLILWILFSTIGYGATGSIIAARIVGSTTATSTTTPYFSACGIASACTGWVLELDETVSGWTPNTVGNYTGESYSLGIGTNNNPTNANIIVTVTSQGYTNAGVATTYTRTLVATHQLRRPYLSSYTAPYPNDEFYDGSSTLTMRFALGGAPLSPGGPPQDGYVYSGDTSITVSVAANIYTYGSQGNLIATGLSVTNNSTLNYFKAIANWVMVPLQRITGSTLTLRVVGGGHGPHDGKPLACVIFTVTDAHSHSQTVTVTLPTIDYSQGDPIPVQEYIGTLSTSTFTQADLLTANFKAVPWLGVTASIMDTSDGANTQPTPLYAPVTYICDTAGTFGTAAAVVDGTNGNDSTCVADSEANFNANPNSNLANSSPCATVNKAIVVLRAYNGAHSSPSRTDEAGSVWVKAGTYTWTGASVSIGASSGTNYDKAWLNVQPFPGVAQSAVSVTAITSTTYNNTGTTPFHVKGLTVNLTSGSPVELFKGGGTSTYAWIDSDALTFTSGTTFLYNFGPVFYTWDTTPGDVINGFEAYGNTAYTALLRGVNLSGRAGTIIPYTAVGNLFVPSGANTTFSISPADTAIPVTSLQTIFAFNKLENLKVSSSAPLLMLSTLSSILGALVEGNIFEYNAAAGGTMVVGIAKDGSTGNPTNNVLLWNNTLSGERINRDYNDSGNSFVLRTGWAEIGNVYDSAAIKTDTFTGNANAARVGNWAGEYSVGFWGSIDAESAYNGSSSTPVGAASCYQAEFTGLFCKFPVANSNAQASTEAIPPVFNQLTYIGFVNRLGWNGNATGAGNGDYHLLSTSPALGLIRSGGCVLPYDLDGQLRNCTYGAAGAYEIKQTQVFGF